MLNEKDQVRTYNGGNGLLCIPSIIEKALEYEMQPNEEWEEPIYQYVYFGDIKNVYRHSPQLIKNRKIGFHKDDEKQVYKQLMIKVEQFYDKDSIRNMILDLDNIDENIGKIVEIKDLNLMEDIYAELVYLKNTNKHIIASKMSDYIYARLEEIREGNKKSELEPTETETVNEEVVSEPLIEKEEAKIVVKEEKPKKPRKPKNTNK